MSRLFPQLQVYPTSGLTFRWAAYEGGGSSFSASLGPDGVGVGMVMDVLWEDLDIAIQQLLGYSYRDTFGGTSYLRRILPWQHPYWPQLVCRRVERVQGLRSEGNSVSDPEDLDFTVSRQGMGMGTPINFGPWSRYHLARLTVQFWRPPYFLRSDADILSASSQPQEWLRYVDRNWAITTQMLSKENSTYDWSPPMAPANTRFQGSVGIPLSRMRVTRKWYQIPEACIFSIIDGVPIGTPDNFLYMQTPTRNPITNYQIPASAVAGNAGYHAYPLPGTVNSPIGGGAVDTDPANRMFGCLMGTLLFMGVEFIPRELQLPAYLMQIPIFANNEAISQTQYDCVLHFDLFDPQRANNVTTSNTTLPSGAALNSAWRGHNLMPFSGSGMWYPVQSQVPVGGTPDFSTPFNFADPSDLFRVL